jgi:hypothetical protein
MFLPLHILTGLSVLFLVVLIVLAWRGRDSRRRSEGQAPPPHSDGEP